MRIQNYYANFIENVLEKDVTFTNRTVLWDYGLLVLYNNPLFGIGYNSASKLSSSMLGVMHMHNLFMNILYMGGFIGFSLFVTITALAVKKLYMYRKSKCGYYLTLVIFVGFFMSLADTFDNAAFWILIMLAYHIDSLVINNKKIIIKWHHNTSPLLRIKQRP